MSWEDTEETKLEKNLGVVATELIVSGERQHREFCQRQYEWRIKRKADLIEKIRERKEEAERQERERLIRLEKERVDRLLGDATALRQADDIRAYVKAVSTRYRQETGALTTGELESWAEWAVAQADRIDPVRSGRFLESIKDPDDEQETEDS